MVPAPGVTLATVGGGFTVRFALEVPEPNDVCAAVLPETDTLHAKGEFDISALGIVNESSRLLPPVGGITSRGLTVTACEPLLTGGVMVTVTLEAGMEPVGYPVPCSVTVLPGEAMPGEVLESSMT